MRNSTSPNNSSITPNPTDAAQFMPFAALTGFAAEVRKQEKQREPRRMVGEERAGHIMRMFCRLNKGDVVQITYYNRDTYRTVVASIRQIDATFHVLELTECQSITSAEHAGYVYKPSSLKIPFEDIWDIDWA